MPPTSPASEVFQFAKIVFIVFLLWFAVAECRRVEYVADAGPLLQFFQRGHATSPGRYTVSNLPFTMRLTAVRSWRRGVPLVNPRCIQPLPLSGNSLMI